MQNLASSALPQTSICLIRITITLTCEPGNIMWRSLQEFEANYASVELFSRSQRAA